MEPAADAQPLACYFSDAFQDQKSQPADMRPFNRLALAANGPTACVPASAPGHLHGLDSPGGQEESNQGDTQDSGESNKGRRR